MQMQPIHPLGSPVVGAKEKSPDNSGKSIDSILSSLTDTKNAAEDTSSGLVGEKAEIAPQPHSKGYTTQGGSDPPLEAEITNLAMNAVADQQLQMDDSKIAVLAEIETAEEIPKGMETPSAIITAEQKQTENIPVLPNQLTVSVSLSEGQSEIQKTNPEKTLDSIPNQGKQDTLGLSTVFQNPVEKPETIDTRMQTQALQPQKTVPLAVEKEIAVTIPLNENQMSPGPMLAESADADGKLLSLSEKFPHFIEQRIASSVNGLNFSGLTQNPAANPELGNTVQAAQEGASLVDFQFAEILGRGSIPTSEAIANLVPLRQRNNWSATMEKPFVTPTGPESTAEATILKIFEELMAGNKSGSNDANPFQTSHNSFFSTPTSSAAGEAAIDFGTTMTQNQATGTISTINSGGSAVKLPSGTFVAENTIVDHVVKHASFFTLREGHGVSIKMHPEELGNLNMRLVSDENGIKAQIQVQSLQVQEILEKHLFRLKEGFEQQGLNLHDIQVSVNSGKNSNPDFFDNQFNPQNQPQTSNTVAANKSQNELIEEILATPTRSEGIINLRI